MALPIKCKKYIYQNVILIEISKHKLTVSLSGFICFCKWCILYTQRILRNIFRILIKLVSHTARHSSTSCPMTLPLKVFVHLVLFSIRETYTLPELLSKGVSYISSQRQGISIPKPTESLKNKLFLSTIVQKLPP